MVNDAEGRSAAAQDLSVRSASGTRASRGAAIAVMALLAVIGGALGSVDARAEAADRYAYLFLQGRIVDDDGTHPAEGLTVRLTAGAQVFESVTDPRGVFVFAKLPVASYQMQVVTPEGRVIRSIRRIEDASRIRLRIRTGRGEASPLRVRPQEDRVAVEVPKPEPSWGRFWKEIGIIVVTAGIFAL